MSEWLTIPSARPPEETIPRFKLWRAQGYNIALAVDNHQMVEDLMDHVDLIHTRADTGGYPGYAKSVNELIRWVMQEDDQAYWFIPAGDDIDPDPNHRAYLIAAQCNAHFAVLNVNLNGVPHGVDVDPGLFGVMQPTGDRWGEEDPFSKVRWPGAPAYIDRICGSAFIGREFAKRMYQGKGPLWPGWFHMRVDEELQCVAEKMGVLWQRRDLIHMHHHAQRQPGPVPEFLREAYSQKHWCESTALFEQRKAAGFPGHEPITTTPEADSFHFS